MKKVFILAYARKNLGDDLFIKMLLEKYSKINFYIKAKESKFLDWLGKYKNLHILIGEDTDEELYKMRVEEYDAYVYIGGSIFMEGGKVYNLSSKFYDFVKRCKEKNIPFCYISSNYGPYQTQEYFDLSRKNFQSCTDICFRDKYSYDLFKDIKSVRYAPDFAFSYNLKEKNKISNSIGISIINLEIRKDLKQFAQNYYDFLIYNIKQYLQQGNTVYLYSFCEYEQDEIIIDKILKEFKNNSNVIGIRYNGDIDKFLDMYSKMEYMICSRFHAMVLSCIARQKIFVLSYSKKIDNVIHDLELNLPISYFDEIDLNTEITKKEFVSIEEEKISNIIENAKKQDKILEKYITEKSQK